MSDVEVKVVKVDSIEVHPGADRLEFIKVGGMDFRCAVSKGKFKVGDLCIYIMPDCVLPQLIIDKLQTTSSIKVDARIRPIRIRGEYSEGLCLVPNEWIEEKYIKEDKDIKDILGIIKYEPPEQRNVGLKNSNKINFNYKNPNFVEYKCVEKYKKYPKVMEEVEGDVVATIKYHGSNARFGLVKKNNSGLWFKLKSLFVGSTYFLVGSHSVIKRPAKKWSKSQEYVKEDSWWKIAKKYDIENKVKELRNILGGNKNTEVVVYGEMIGKGIQKGYSYGIQDGELELKVFDIMINKKYLGWDEVVNLCSQVKLPTVEVVYRGPWKKDIVELASAVDTYNNQKYVREGIVIRPIQETRHPKCGRVIMKYLNPAYEADKNNSEWH